MTKVYAAEEVVESLLLVLAKTELSDCLSHLLNLTLVLELQELALLEDELAEDEFVLRECTSLVTEDVIDLA